MYYSISQSLQRTCLRNGIVMPLLLILFFCVTGFPFLAVAQLPDVNILNLVFKTNELPHGVATAYNHGFNASIWSRNFTLAGRKVNMKLMTPAPGAVASSIEKEVGSRKDLFVVLGPASAPHTLDALSALRKKDIVALGPITEISSARIWDEHLYYFFINTDFSARALLRHAVINLRVRRLGFMYTTDIFLGDNEYKRVKENMEGMHRELCGVFSIDGRASYTANDKEFNERWEAFAETLPQAVIIISVPNSAVKLFVQKMLQDPRTNSAYLMVITLLERMTIRKWEKARADGAPVFPGQVITTASSPSPLDNSSAMAGKFRSVIDRYVNSGVNTGNGQGQANSSKWSRSGVTLSGWVAGEVLFQAISGFSPALERKDFIASLFNQRSYIIEEVVIGTFGDNISEDLEEAGAVARCNEGAATVYVKQHKDERNSETVPEGILKEPINVCQAKDTTLTDSAAIVTVHFTDNGDVKNSMLNNITRGHEVGIRFRNSKPKHDMTLKVLQSTYDAVTSTVIKEKETKWTNIVTGVVHETTLDVPNLTFIDPLITLARVNTFRKNVVFLSPVLEQQFFALAQYVASLPDCTVRAVIRSLAANEALNMLKKSLLTFDVTLTSSVLLKENDKIEDKIQAFGLTLLVGIEEEDIPVYVAHLERNTNARLVILFDPFAIFYKELRVAFKGKDAAERLLFITNLPHWADRNSPSRMVRNYHKNIANFSEWSPLSLQSFIVGRFIREVVEHLEVVNSSSVSDYFYSAIAVHLDDMSFGPFADSNSVTCTSDSDPNSLGCAKNFGATSISIWPMSRVYDPNVGVLFGPVTPSLKYLVPSTGLTRAQQIGIIVGTLVGAAVLAAVLVLFCWHVRKGNANAPKDVEHPVTLIFTDIQSSTALWAACPQSMADALEVHHRMIRRLISKYRCYEVKTVGDSFMIACKSAYAAVQLVGDMQRTFLKHDWRTSAIDKAYHELEELQAEEDVAYKPPTARLDDAVYREHWSGLRVRAGVHTGLCEIRYDEVTKRYDYYGSTSNTAARTESVANGGQVLLTRAAYMALSTAERAGLNVTALGAVELRGVPEPVEMLQLNPVPGRAFAKLRLGGGNDEFDFESCSVTETETSYSVSEALTPAAENVLAVLDDISAPFPPQQRLKALEPFCNRWKVTMPVAKNQEDLLPASRVAAKHLAMKISRVNERRNLSHNNTSTALEMLSSTRASFLMQNSSRVCSFRGTAALGRMMSGRSVGNEVYSRGPYLSFNVQRGSSVFSYTTPIRVREPSFLHFN